ncbi:MAG: hypothetical protein JWQ35_352 [Bacteriovoracaceae bacterium]|nr:hypothetical protein [Bacteriovoracaceae bacterium]
MSGPIQNQFEKVLALLKKSKARFALAGGYAASLYRETDRFTKDIDFILWTENNVIEDAKIILNRLGLEAHEVREAQLRGGPHHKMKTKSTPVWMVAGRSKSKQDVPVDFLFHLFPWMLEALTRAQENQIDIGFGWRIPVLTCEDVLLSKFMALGDKSERIDDLSDIQQIFKYSDVDLNYLVGRMKKLHIFCPKSAEAFVPPVIRKISKEIRSGMGKIKRTF